MEVRILKETPHPSRSDSKKVFKVGEVYAVDNEYGRLLVEQKLAKEVHAVTMKDLKRKNKQ